MAILASLDPVVSVPGRPKRLAVLGATGSIGRQALDIVAAHPERYTVTVLTTNRRIEEVVELAVRHRPALIVVADGTKYSEACRRLRDAGVTAEVAAGSEALETAVSRDDVDMVLTATVGYSGLLPTVAAIRAGKDVALANKETLVVAGDYIRKMPEVGNVRIYPVDSEHSAIAQCLRGEDLATVDRLIITASGGPFRTWDIDRMAYASAADALHHPNWKMGAKITIDSATMMNKAFEIIEAHHLFGISPDRISAIVHPQSIVHSMVRFDDGAVKAQLGVPDMHLPIAYAMGLNNRMAASSRPLDFDDMTMLTFEHPDSRRFPCLDFAHIALERRGTAACIINAANEIAVAAFLDGHIRFTDFARIIGETLERVPDIAEPSLNDYVATNNEARAVASSLCKQSIPN